MLARLLTIAVVGGLTACATPLEDLLQEANATDDWRAVNARLELLERMGRDKALRSGNPCPTGEVVVVSTAGDARCQRLRSLTPMRHPGDRRF